MASQTLQRTRESLLPYGRHDIDEQDIQAVIDVLRSDWITTGPKIGEFEEKFAAYTGAAHAVSFSSGTAALHGAAFAAGLERGDEAITTPFSFCATANCILYQGATPVFCDICPDVLTIDPDEIARRITRRTKAILPVDYAGHPAPLDDILAMADARGLTVIEDACHALGAEFKGKRVGGLAHMTVFSFHPVKHITTGEGGMVATNDRRLADALRAFRNHGIDSDAKTRQDKGQWHYEMKSLGFNYRLSDINCALGSSQLAKLDRNLSRRRSLARRYNAAFRELKGVTVPRCRPEVNPAWHLYALRFDLDALNATKGEIFGALRAANLGVNVHYLPIHLHPYYRERFGYRQGDFPVAEKAYERVISLPLFPAMSDADADDVIAIVTAVVERFAGRN